jgi:hypothetical protein
MEKPALSSRRSFSIPQEWREKIQYFGEANRSTLKAGCGYRDALRASLREGRGTGAFLKMLIRILAGLSF